MSVEFYRESPGKLDSRTLSRETLIRGTGRNPWTPDRLRSNPGIAPLANPQCATSSKLRDLDVLGSDVRRAWLIEVQCGEDQGDEATHDRHAHGVAS